jgi:cytoskeletal protein RodZ
MSDDVFEAFGDDDIFTEDEEPQQQSEGGGQDRTFIIAVAILAGLLVLSLISFGVWALVLNRPQEAAPPPTEVVASPTVEVIVVEDTATPEPPEPTETPAPTETPEPTPTPLLGPTATPNGEDAEGEADPDTVTAVGVTEGEGEDENEGEAEPTQVVRRTPTPMPTPQATPTPRGSDAGTDLSASSGQLSQTGLSEWLLIGLAMLLVAVMVAARRLRQA